jgi:uncharacterized protein YodC (DUF2158 family)
MPDPVSMAETFKIGDKVLLKSGSPVMTVHSITNGIVRCVYFAGNDRRDEEFPAETLERYMPSGPQGGYRGGADDY